jgi:hypothetical protein
MINGCFKPAPFDRSGRFFRGNLHCHSTRSDGRIEPEEVAAAYRRLGYDFICLSDHFEAEYGWQVVDTTALRDASFTTLIGSELSRPGPEDGKWWLVAAGLPLDFPQVSNEETGPELARRAQAAGAFVALLHPGFNATRRVDIEGLDALDAVEIYNHGVARAFDRGDGWYLCQELLDEGRDLTCIASDDAHFMNNGLGTIGGAWIELRSETLEPTALLAALKEGSFYSTTGPQITDLEFIGSEIRIECTPADVVCVNGPRHLSSSVAHRAWDGTITSLCRTRRPDETSWEGNVEDATAEGIVRCRLQLNGWAVGDWWRLTVRDSVGRCAWTNPARLS